VTSYYAQSSDRPSGEVAASSHAFAHELMSAPEPSDNLTLDLNEGQRLALAGLQAFLNSGVSHRIQESGPFTPTTALASHALSAAVMTIQSGLPSCPFRPAGQPVSIQFLPPNNAIGFQCAHRPKAHCWDGSGTPRTC
jgi:hypothetical protein